MIIKLFLIITLIPMIISDFRYRYISVFWLAAFTILSACLRFYKHEIYSTLISTMINIFIIIFMFLGTLLYFTIRYKALQKRFLDCIGLGDILFLFSITLLFDPKPFITFLIFSLIFSLAWYYIVIILFKKDITIPLVATTSMCYIFYIFIKLTGYGI